MNYIKKSIMTLALCTLTLSLFTGCGQNTSDVKAEEINNFEASLSGYLNTINQSASNIDSLNVEADTATAAFLENIDSINTAITGISVLKAPEGFEDVETYSYEALNYISMAASIYHDIYDSSDYSNYDMELDHQAYNYYTSAIASLNKVGEAIKAGTEK